MKLSNKIFLYFGTFTFLIILVFVTVNYYVIQRSLHQRARKDLHQLVESTNSAVENMLDTAIQNYLRGLVEQDIAILKQLQDKVLNNTMTEQQAKKAFQKNVASQKIGESGYIVALKPQGPKIILDIHPFLQGKDCASNKGCQDWIAQKNGYSEYDWQNPEDKQIRKKVSYIMYFEPWDWVVGATSYKDEFTQLIKIDDLKRFVSSLTILDQGYFFLIDDKLTVLIHPELNGISGKDLQNIDGRFIIRELIESTESFYYYRWKNPSEKKARKKFAYAKKLDNFNWYIVATGYLEDVTLPIDKLMRLSYILIAFISVLLTGLILFFSRSLSRPLDELIRGLQAFHKNKKIFKMSSRSVAEIEAVGYSIEKMTAELIKSEQDRKDLFDQLDSIINSMPSILVCIDNNEKIIIWNDKATEYSSLLRSEALHQPMADVFPEFKKILNYMKENIKDQGYYSDICKIQGKDGVDLHFAITFYPLHSGLQAAVIRIDDISEKVHMEDLLLQRHKMESVGFLAGGIAHDFNNILHPILGHTEMLLDDVPEESPLREGLREIYSGSLRARDLVKQILTFSRQENSERINLYMQTIIKEALKLIRSTIPTTIDIKQDLQADCRPVNAAPTQIHQIIMNLTTNAYHSMKESGGKLKVNLKEIEHNKMDLNIPDLEPGVYALLTISDEGIGMDQDLTQKIFDPFFTTKEKSKGTGMGLAVVHGIVKQMGGTIQVYSTPNIGTEFKVYFPVIKDSLKDETIQEKDAIQVGTENILLVDDEKVILKMGKKQLSRLGYDVSSYDSSIEALEVFRSDPAKFDIVITDKQMPGLTGDKLAVELLKIRPEIPILLCTGFSDAMSEEKAASLGIKGFLMKPILINDLALKIREVLNKQNM